MESQTERAKHSFATAYFLFFVKAILHHKSSKLLAISDLNEQMVIEKDQSPEQKPQRNPITLELSGPQFAGTF